MDDTKIVETNKLGTRQRFTIPALMRPGWKEGDLIRYTQYLGEPTMVEVQNLSYLARLKE